MSDITEFYINGGQDHQGRTLESMLDMPDAVFEASHDFIQTLFPLHEKSYHARVSPIITQEDASEFQGSDVARRNMRRALLRFVSFLGIGDPPDMKRISFWCHPGNHNMLRITRAIRSLRLFGLDEEAKFLFGRVLAYHKMLIGDKEHTTKEYWESALKGGLFDSITKRFLSDRHIEVD